MNISRLKPIDDSIVRRMMKYRIIPIIPMYEKIRGVIKEETGYDPFISRGYRGTSQILSRYLFVAMMVKYTDHPYREIADMIWKKNHSSVNHCMIQVNNLCDTDKQFKELYERIENKIKNNLL